MVAEFWPGWFDNWGDGHHKMDLGKVVTRVSNILKAGASVNLYMFHGIYFNAKIFLSLMILGTLRRDNGKTTPQISNVIGQMRKNFCAARGAHTCVHSCDASFYC